MVSSLLPRSRRGRGGAQTVTETRGRLETAGHNSRSEAVRQ